MEVLTGRVQDLVDRLDALGAAPSLFDLADALRHAQLTYADVAPYAVPHHAHYNRRQVVLRAGYEILVMTWQPGQASAPHDHAGSVCAMQALQGEAIESIYCLGADGYVELDFETAVGTGEVTAGQDAGIHAVRNSADAASALVTIHVYAPPLRDFRRFVVRPDRSPPRGSLPLRGEAFHVAIVGGGLSGIATAAQLLRQSRERQIPVRVALYERRGAVGEGVAYATRETAHLLNVPAARMSLWPDRPDDFARWAAGRLNRPCGAEYLPRLWYGEYLRDRLAETARDAEGYGELLVRLDEVRRLARRPAGGWLVHAAAGPSWRADAVALAVGHRPPEDPLRSRWTGSRLRYLVDPWRPLALAAVGADEPVAVVGSGLTAVDAVLSLDRDDRRAPIYLLSRRGLLPQAHAHAPLPAANLDALLAAWRAAPGPLRAADLCRALRAEAREQATRGVDWRAVVDGLRPHTAPLWQALSVAERRRFLEHLRPFWEVHRHRMALGVATRFGELRDCGRFEVLAGRVVRAVGHDQGVELLVQHRGEPVPRTLHVGWVVNCTGPAPSNSVAANPAVGSLLVDGWLACDALGLGVDTSPAGRAVDCRGQEVADLAVVGTLRKPQLWESTAAPEIRVQAADAARTLLELATELTRGRRSSEASSLADRSSRG